MHASRPAAPRKRLARRFALTLGAPRCAAQDRAAIKAERLAQRTTKTAAASTEEDPLAGNYGDTPLVQSAEITGRVWTRLSDLSAAHAGQRVLVRGRVHTLRGKGKSAFVILRQQTATLQARSGALSRAVAAWPPA